ncbi:MAG: OprD family porin [Bacteroidetes bacterium]|nr:MAG: OprD family porin [Bacteroidota bacterium]
MLAERQATFVVLYDFLKGHIFSLVYQPNLATDELAEFEEFRAKYLDDGLEEDTMPPLISDTNWENTFTQYSDQEFLDLVLDIAGNVIPIYGSWNLTQVENLIRIFTEVDNLVSNAELDGVAFVAMGSEAEEWGLPQVMPHYFGTYQVGTGDANFPVLVFNTDGTFAADTVYERWMIHELGHHYDFSVLGPPLFSLTISEVWGWGSDGTTYPTDDLNPVNAPSLDLDPHGYGFSSSYPTLSIRQQIWEDFAEVFTAAIYYFEAGGDQQGLDRLNEINRIWNPDDLFVPNAVRRCTVETLFEVEWPYHLDETADDYYPTACDEVDATQEYSQ